MKMSFYPIPYPVSPKLVFITKSQNKTKMKTKQKWKTTPTMTTKYVIRSINENAFLQPVVKEARDTEIILQCDV